MRIAAPPCALGLFLFAACGDRSPPALWPEPPPPTLAKPIGIDEPVHETTDTSAPATPTSTGAAADPAPKGGEPPISEGPLPRGRPPMPPLVP